MVEKIKHFRAKFQVHSFSDGSFLNKCQVEDFQIRSYQNISPFVAIESHWLKYKCGWIYETIGIASDGT